MDKDLIRDIDVFVQDSVNCLRETTEWITRQINILVHRKRLELIERKPGSIYCEDPIIIYVKMVRWADLYFKRGSTLDEIFAHRAKFNDALNDCAGRLNHRILTINSCNMKNHFTHKGDLSVTGKEVFWAEMDDLLERFDANKVKLLPNLFNKQQQQQRH